MTSKRTKSVAAPSSLHEIRDKQLFYGVSGWIELDQSASITSFFSQNKENTATVKKQRDVAQKKKPSSSKHKQFTAKHSKVSNASSSNDEFSKSLFKSIGPNDIICGRNLSFTQGRKVYLEIVAKHSAAYAAAVQKRAVRRTKESGKSKREIAETVINMIHERGSRFIQVHGNTARLLESEQVIRKVSFALRDAAARMIQST